MKKLFLVLAGSMLLATPAMAHRKAIYDPPKAHRPHHHRKHRYHRVPKHNHCHNHVGYSHCHGHTHGGPGRGHHGRKYMHTWGYEYPLPFTFEYHIYH